MTIYRCNGCNYETEDVTELPYISEADAHLCIDCADDYESDETTTESDFDTFELDPELKEQLADYQNAVL